MPFVRHIFYFDTGDTPSPTIQQGPFTITNPFKLYQVRLSGAIYSPISTVTTSSVLFASPAWGVQFVGHGDSPFTIPDGSDSTAWFFNTYENVAAAAVAWAPSTDTAAAAVGNPFSGEWHGQLPINGTIDFYVTVGDPFDIGADESVYGQLEVLANA
jgi:hypothetical protein